MKNLPVTLLIALALALCAVCVAQWRRESVFRHRLAEAGALLKAEVEACREIAGKAAGFEQEIARLTQLRADTEAKLVEVTDELTATRQRIAGAGAEAAEHARAVEAQNAAIVEANTRLEAVTSERDRLVEELNRRTRAYNELMARQNRGAR